MVTKEVKVISNRFRGDFERDLGNAIAKMEAKTDIVTVEIQFSTGEGSGDNLYFSALLIGKGIPS
jgi:hypothetical protein